MVELDNCLEKDVENVWRIVLRVFLVLDVNSLKVSYGVESGVAKEAGVSVALDLERVEEQVYGIGRGEILLNGLSKF